MRRAPRPFTRLVIAGSLSGVFAACASTGTSSPDDHQPADRVVATDQNGHAIHTTDYNSATEVQIHAPPSSVMAALSEIYPDLGIPIGTLMTGAGQIGNRNYRVPGHRLKTMQLSQVLDCGQESVTGSRADVDDITLNVLSTVKPAGDSGSIVSTYVTATARPFGTSSDPVTCATSGRLERIISERVVKALGGSAPS